MLIFMLRRTISPTITSCVCQLWTQFQYYMSFQFVMDFVAVFDGFWLCTSTTADQQEATCDCVLK